MFSRIRANQKEQNLLAIQDKFVEENVGRLSENEIRQIFQNAKEQRPLKTYSLCTTWRGEQKCLNPVTLFKVFRLVNSLNKTLNAGLSDLDGHLPEIMGDTYFKAERIQPNGQLGRLLVNHIAAWFKHFPIVFSERHGITGGSQNELRAYFAYKSCEYAHDDEDGTLLTLAGVDQDNFDYENADGEFRLRGQYAELYYDHICEWDKSKPRLEFSFFA